jgi:hypothetical protein
MSAYSGQFRVLDGVPGEVAEVTSQDDRPVVLLPPSPQHLKFTICRRESMGRGRGGAAPWTTYQLARMKSHWPADEPET